MFYERLVNYYQGVANALSFHAELANLFMNSGNIGRSRELIYAKFLEKHIPSSCKVFLGGYVFNNAGQESNQLDIIVTSSLVPRFDFRGTSDKGDSIASVNGCLAVASIKSNLNKATLFDSLENIASIPANDNVQFNNNLLYEHYEHWPLKIIYAHKGIKQETFIGHIRDFYIANHDIPENRRPDVIHVSGQYTLLKIRTGMHIENENGDNVNRVEARMIVQNPDVQAINYIVYLLQEYVTVSNHLILPFHDVFNNVSEEIRRRFNADH